MAFGFTGGMDGDGTQEDGFANLALWLNTSRFLVLQPYRWPSPEQFQAHPDEPFTGGGLRIVLNEQPALGEGQFDQRAFFLPDPSRPDFEATYPVGSTYHTQAEIIKYVTNPALEIALLPTYSIRSQDSPLRQPIEETLFELVTAALASQRTTTGAVEPGRKPVVILLCDTFDDVEQQDQFRDLMQGGFSQSESQAQQAISRRSTKPGARAVARSRVDGATARRDWLAARHLEDQYRVRWAPATLAGVQEDVTWAKAAAGRVVLVAVGSVPQPLFVWSMANSGWPSFFEGQNTGNIAVSLARPYFHAGRVEGGWFQYPTDVVRYVDTETQAWQVWRNYPSTVPEGIQEAANQIQEELGQWDITDGNAPPDRAARTVKQYWDEEDNGALHRYYRKVKGFYAVPANDKLRLGSAFAEYVMTHNRTPISDEGPGRGREHGHGHHEVHGAHADHAGRAGAAEPTVLEATYYRLRQSLSPADTLDVVPGAFPEGGINEFYTELLGKEGLVLTDADVVALPSESELQRIVATGRTEMLGIPFTATITFTAPQGTVIADGRYDATGGWNVGPVPWVVLEQPFAQFYVPDLGVPSVAAIGGHLAGAGTGVELAFRLPAAEGIWQLVGLFAEPYPSIRMFYQLAGGVDLVRALPEPFALLSGFALRDVQLVYDEDAGQVTDVGFTMSTTSEVALLDTLALKEITAQVTVLSPAVPAERATVWSVTGVFTLGDEKNPGTVQLNASGPGLTLSGALVSGVLRIGDIVAMFAPGVDLGIPDSLAVTDFQAFFKPESGDYRVQCDLNVAWPVTVGGTTLFSIDALKFAASGDPATSSGNLTGLVTVDTDVQLTVYGSYDTDEGWEFGVVQPPETEIDLGTLITEFLPAGWHVEGDYAIADLALTVAYTAGSYSFSGRTADWWTVPFLGGEDLQIRGELALGYQATKTDEMPAGYSARLSAEIMWHGIDLTVYGDYRPNTLEYGIKWGALEGKVVQQGAGGAYLATLKFGDTTTIGSMIEDMVSWATGSRFALEAPWSILNAVPVGGLALEYRFNPTNEAENTVSFTIDIGPIELGFARIDSIAVLYDDQAARKVSVTLKGSFPWNIGDGAVGNAGSLGPWDAAAPGAAPAPPGTGNEYLDLRMLALGQHVKVPGLAAAQSVQNAIEIMAADLPDTVPGQVPLPAQYFSPASAWIIGADMGVLRFEDENGATGYLLTVQTVFNDPSLYALRLALAGPAAKVFSGLDFQIMYRQVSETVGVYQAELTLPDQMRRVELGACTLTLPSVAVAVYTNGDFQIDVGFPWNGDFSRSFTVEGVIAPGIPVTGSGGFYFGKLSGTTSDRVPQTLNGTFSPVLVFGLGLTLGFGKSVQYGPLKAGFSLTAGGIVEGVLATFNPYTPATTSAAPAQVQDGYYFWLRGAVAISGRLYGSVDFSVIKAEVDVAFAVTLQLTYESYVSMTITVIVSVDVNASVSIDLGLFSIRLSFSFSMRLQEAFTIANTGTPPWTVAAGPAPRALRVSSRPGATSAAAAALSAAATPSTGPGCSRRAPVSRT
ncbi:hypothetical protein ACFQ9X_29450 [Catenulispora yoronensis]